MTIKRVLVLAGLVVAAVSACGSDDDGASDAPASSPQPTVVTTVEPPADVPDTTVEPASPPTTEDAPDDITDALAPGEMAIELVDCEQFPMVAKVDAAAAQSLVPDEVDLLLDDAGLATFTHVSKSCSDIVVDGVSQGPGHFDTQWITIVGPADQRTYAAYPDHFVIPTDYLYPVNFATDNPGYQEAASAFGVPIELATMQMDPLGPGPWTGSTEGPDGSYQWSVDHVDPGGMQVYFVHVLERTEQEGNFRYDIECPAILAWNAALATVALESGSAVSDAFGPEIAGDGYGVELSCDVTIVRTPPVVVTSDISYTETKQLDVYAPAAGSDWPVVVFFHGGNPTDSPEFRTTIPEPAALAARGLVVYVPHWASLGPDGGSEDTVCAMSFAQATAGEHGGDADRVTISGYSTGGFTAAVHALMGDDPPFASEDCLVDPLMVLPAAAVPGGTPYFAVDAARAGAFATNEQWNELTPDELDAFDPYLLLGRNPNIHFVIVVGEEDHGGGALGDIPIVESSLQYHQAMLDAGYDVELVTVPGGHVLLPGSFATWMDTIVRTAQAT